MKIALLTEQDIAESETFVAKMAHELVVTNEIVHQAMRNLDMMLCEDIEELRVESIALRNDLWQTTIAAL